jgi:adenylate cyclase
MPKVIIDQPGGPALTVELTGGETSFGRSEESDVVLVAEEVSRMHAKIFQRNDKMVLIDLKSLNGTYVNRQRIVERVLSNEDEIWLGSKCSLKYDEGAGVVPLPTQESQVSENVSRIREEMDRLGTSMTLMGQKQPDLAAGATMQAPSASADDVAKMGQAYRRLAALHKASQVMSGKFELDTRLRQVLDIVMEVMGAERGFVMMRDEETDELTVRVASALDKELDEGAPSMGIASRAAIDGEPVLMLDSSTDQDFGMRESIIRSQIISAMCVPLKLHDRLLGSIYIDTRKAGVRFSDEDLELFASLGSQSAMAIDNVRLHDQVVEAEKKRQNLGRFLSPAIVDKVMSEGDTLQLGGQRTTVTTLFCDIRGFTNMAERITPAELVIQLNEYFAEMTQIVFDNSGTLDKYVGDEIMAVFGAPLSSGDDAYNAVRAALAIQKKNQELNEFRTSENRPQFDLGIGIDTGEVTAGYFGSPMRMEFTVVGDRVNTAARFCGMAGPGKIVVGEETYNAVEARTKVRPLGTVALKGKEKPVHAFEIVSIND